MGAFEPDIWGDKYSGPLAPKDIEFVPQLNVNAPEIYSDIAGNLPLLASTNLGKDYISQLIAYAQAQISAIFASNQAQLESNKAKAESDLIEKSDAFMSQYEEAQASLKAQQASLTSYYNELNAYATGAKESFSGTENSSVMTSNPLGILDGAPALPAQSNFYLYALVGIAIVYLIGRKKRHGL